MNKIALALLLTTSFITQAVAHDQGVTYRGKTWRIASPKTAFGTTKKHVIAANPVPKGAPGTGYYGIIEADDAAHTTYVSCGWQGWDGEVAPEPFIWIDATKKFDGGPNIDNLCRKYGIELK